MASCVGASHSLIEIYKRWKTGNYYRENEIKTCAKFEVPQKEYTLYKGLIIHSSLHENKYVDEYPSAWTTDIEVARKYSGYGLGKIITTVVKSENVMMDFACFNDYESEVVLLPNSYDVREVS